MKFEIGTRVMRVKGSNQIGTVKFIYDRYHTHVDKDGNTRIYASPDELAVHFDGFPVDATTPFASYELKAVS